MLGANPIREHVTGAPRQPGDRVRVVAAVDRNVHDVSAFIGETGTVAYLEYECGCGQSFPDDPMIGVTLSFGQVEEFWAEELAECLCDEIDPLDRPCLMCDGWGRLQRGRRDGLR